MKGFFLNVLLLAITNAYAQLPSDHMDIELGSHKGKGGRSRRRETWIVYPTPTAGTNTGSNAAAVYTGGYSGASPPAAAGYSSSSGNTSRSTKSTSPGGYTRTTSTSGSTNAPNPLTIVSSSDSSSNTAPKVSEGLGLRQPQGTTTLPPKFNLASEADDFYEGDLDSSFDSYINPNIGAMMGNWNLLLDRSESTDAIMASLGISGMKRAVMRTASTGLEISTGSNGKRPSIKMTTRLPMNNVKSGVVFTDGKPFSVTDSDTGPWTSVSVVRNGRLMQKRVSQKGTMYDVRATLSSDPQGRTKEAPLHVFKWTFIDKSGRKMVSHRYFAAV